MELHDSSPVHAHVLVSLILQGSYSCSPSCHEFMYATTLLWSAKKWLTTDTLHVVLTMFLTPLSWWALSLKRRRFDMDVSFTFEHLTVFHYLCIVPVWVYILMTIYCNKKFLWQQLRDVLIYGTRWRAQAAVWYCMHLAECTRFHATSNDLDKYVFGPVNGTCETTLRFSLVGNELS